ncbi:hypothetical protein Sjap_009618 [Stephania japonica]|uniref:non-specific serine/threonine protein kinase n=1 Tax=Stephania japonica TaxID=461633 RepID=A0AAP0P6C5_9MAGN
MNPAGNLAQGSGTTTTDDNDDDYEEERLQLGAPFNESHYNELRVKAPATISNGALQITPDSRNEGFNLQHTSGRILYSKRSFKLWDSSSSEKIASFNTSFNINIYRFPNSTPGEGFAFIIAPDLEVPTNSDGQFLGLTNARTDGNPNNRLVAVELDTVKQEFDPDDNHMGLNLNSVRSNKTFNLSAHGIQIAPQVPKNYTVWISYSGRQRRLTAYMAEEGRPMPPNPIMNESLNLRDYVSQYSYFGFSASTGNLTQLNCVLGWNLTVEMLEIRGGNRDYWVKIVVGAGVPVAALIVIIGGLGLWYYHLRRKRMRKALLDLNIVGALKNLPGTPREFPFKELKKATDNFDEKNKLGQGGFGVVYKGVLPQQNLQVAVKKFSRDSIKGKDDFLAELTIINRLRHKHLVPLLGQ